LHDQHNRPRVAIAIGDRQWDPLTVGMRADDHELAGLIVMCDVRRAHVKPLHVRAEPSGIKDDVRHSRKLSNRLPLLCIRSDLETGVRECPYALGKRKAPDGLGGFSIL
jgi:hypothetical protein